MVVFSDGHEAEGSLEHLAVRFKNKDTAETFKAMFEECQENIGNNSLYTTARDNMNQQLRTLIHGTSDETKNTTDNSYHDADEEAGEERDDDYEDYEDEEEYDENGETIMFHNTATLYTKEESGDFICRVRLIVESW